MYAFQVLIDFPHLDIRWQLGEGRGVGEGFTLSPSSLSSSHRYPSLLQAHEEEIHPCFPGSKNGLPKLKKLIFKGFFSPLKTNVALINITSSHVSTLSDLP